MAKRGREERCATCEHFHNFEAGEPCDVCGHKMSSSSTSIEIPVEPKEGAFPCAILKDFLYLGTYVHASSSEVLKILGITHILNAVPNTHNFFRHTFTYYHPEDERSLQFHDEIQFLEQCAKDSRRVLVHCMTGKNRSPAIVIAYLMKSKGWRLAQSLQWVKERRTQVDLSPAAHQCLVEFEQRIFGAGKSEDVQRGDRVAHI